MSSAASVRRVPTSAGVPRSGTWTSDAIVLAVVVVVLVLLGLLMSFSASIVDAAETGDPFGMLQRQSAWAAVGVALYFLIARFHVRIWRRLSWLLLAASLLGLVVVLIPGVGLTEFGSTRWIALGPIVIQPSEGAKLATLLWLADVHTRKRERGIVTEEDVKHLLIPALPLLAFEGLLVMLEPDLGTTILLGLTVALVLWADGVPGRTFAGFAATGGVFVALAAVLEPYRFARVSGWLAPTDDPLGNGYQLLQSLYAMGSGGVFGVGLGSSRGKWNFIPNPETDFVYSIIAEELGLVGALFVLGLFVILLAVGMRVARRAEGTFARILALGITGIVVGQALVNVGAVTGLLPITGVTLPLVSIGGSSLVSTLVALGILTSIARSSQVSP